MGLRPPAGLPRMGCSGAWSKSSSDVRVEELKLSPEDRRRALGGRRSVWISDGGRVGGRGSGTIWRYCSAGTGTGMRGDIGEGDLLDNAGEPVVGVGGGRASSWGAGSRMRRDESASGIHPSKGISECVPAGEYKVVRAEGDAVAARPRERELLPLFGRGRLEAEPLPLLGGK